MKEILLVEDSELDAQLVFRALKRHRLANPVRHIRDGLEAMNYLRQTEKVAAIGPGLPGVLLLDLKLPGLSGYEILESLRQRPLRAQMLRVVLSQIGDVHMIKRAYGLGADSYLVKPLREDDLEACDILLLCCFSAARSTVAGTVITYGTAEYRYAQAHLERELMDLYFQRQEKGFLEHLPQPVYDMVASFQRAAIESLFLNTRRAAEIYRTRSIMVSVL